ncbi:CMP-2-keto-3-deoxyoctulosonic acid synthetase [Adlercreutzia sp. ZJ141]|uniref:CMP-2-keto-3-deoxyoctulosonic acid synthetase n=1 Tax=Adlercreutzia sp. ZJ141 TaxID=2709406 RepID=UPI0013EA17CE|nr:CMP-2-keto-3-deoxyoctulosonic acid synthetase [Adlercreutzia sp. ZJ141]
MAQRRKTHRTTSIVARFAVGSLVSCAFAVFIGLGFASAGSGASSDADTFGIDAVSASSAATDFSGATSDTLSTDSSSLAMETNRDISAGIESIEAEEEAARKAAEEAARQEEEARIAAAQQARAEQQATMIADAASAAVAQLSEVDWEVGKDAFVAEWSARIDAYLAGTNLAGYGSVFAEAAWDNGIDPRFSPAISNTESGNGLVCFKPYNAWGWGSSSWSSWEEAIRAHVAGLAKGYGYSITYAGAQKYCPPNYDHWFYNTLGQMMLI